MEERRRYPRVTVSWDITVWKVTVGDLSGTEWMGESVNLSPGGVKVKFGGDLEQGTPVTLIFRPPDGGPIISALSAVVRKDREGHAFAFASLSHSDFVRLLRFVKART